MMEQGGLGDDPIFGGKASFARKSQATQTVRQDMRYVLLVILLALLIFLANQVLLLFTGSAFF